MIVKERCARCRKEIGTEQAGVFACVDKESTSFADDHVQMLIAVLCSYCCSNRLKSRGMCS